MNSDINSFSFKIRLLNTNRNLKKMKDFFIRKQDIYLIKLLEKKTKNFRSIKIDNSLKKIFSYDKSNTTRLYNENEYKTPIKASLKDLNNIRIIQSKLDNINNNTINNSNLDNPLEESKIINNVEDFINFKAENSDMARSNNTLPDPNKNEDINSKNTYYSQNKNNYNKKYTSEKTQTDDIDFNKTKFSSYLINNKKYNFKNSQKFNSLSLPRRINPNFHKYINESRKMNSKYQLLFNEGLNSEKSIFIRNNSPEYINNNEIVNFTKNKRESNNSSNNDKKNYINIILNNRINKNNKINHIFRNEIQNQKVNKNIFYQITDNKSIILNNNLIKSMYNMNETKYKKTMKNLYNVLPKIKMKYKIDL